MKVTEIVCSRSARVNTGNYEGTEFFVSHKAEVDELDDLATADAVLARDVEKALHLQLTRSYKARGKKVSGDEIAKAHGLSHKHDDRLGDF